MKNILAFILVLPILLVGQLNLDNVSMKINPDFHVTSSGNVKTSNGGYLHGGGQLILKANFQDENPTAKSHKITSNFKGENEQKIYSTIKNVGFSELVVSNNSKVESKTNLKLDEGLNLQGGILQVNANYVLDYQTKNPVLNYSSTNFIQGAVKKEIEQDEYFFFPLGSEANGVVYNPLEISGLEENIEFTVELHPKDPNQMIGGNLSSSIKTLSNTEYWEIKPTHSLTSNYDVKFHWGKVTSQTSNYNSLTVSNLQGNTWETLGLNDKKGDQNKGFISINDIMMNGYFVLSNAQPFSAGITSVSQAFCGDANASAILYANGGIPPYKYDWLGENHSTSTVNDLSKGVYFVNVSDASGSLENVKVEIDETSFSSDWNGEIQKIQIDVSANKMTSQGSYSSNSNLARVISSHSIPAGQNGIVEFNVPNNDHNLMFGLTGEETYGDWKGKEYVFEKAAGTNLYTKYHRGSSKRVEGSSFSKNNDKITFEKNNNEIRGYLNGVLVHIFPLWANEQELRVIVKFGKVGTIAEIPHTEFCSEDFLPTQYLTLSSKLSQKKWYLSHTDLNFVFNEPYAINPNSVLNATLYDYNHKVIAEKEDLQIKISQGDNKLTLRCFLNYLDSPNKMYYLKIRNSKGELSYLQLISPQNNLHCNN